MTDTQVPGMSDALCRIDALELKLFAVIERQDKQGELLEVVRDLAYQLEHPHVTAAARQGMLNDIGPASWDGSR